MQVKQRIWQVGVILLLIQQTVWADRVGFWLPISSVNEPTPRAGHSFIWTGQEMIIWGGYTQDGLVRFNDGGRYNPATDRWTRIAIEGAPLPRYWHTAVWTGQEMIIWGGTGTRVTEDTGGRYNPATDTWRPVSTRGAPSPRWGHTVVWTGQEMIVWGGFDAYGACNTGARYDPTADKWQPLSMKGAPEPRYGHTAVWTGHEMIIWGGGPDGVDFFPAYNTGAAYSPVTDSWRRLPVVGAPEARRVHTAVWTGHEMIVWGGVSAFGAEGGHFLDTGAVYDPQGKPPWIPMSDPIRPALRGAHTAIWTGEVMIIWGGLYRDDDIPVDVYRRSGGIFVPETGRWFRTNEISAPQGRAGHTAVWTGQEMIIWGGVDFNTNTYFSAGARFVLR